MRGKVESLTIDVEGKQRMTFALSQDARSEYEAIKDKPDLVIECKPYRKRRSRDANSYLWHLLGEMAVYHNATGTITNKDLLYSEMLQKYGVFTHFIVKPKAVEKFKQSWPVFRELGEITVDGKTGVQFQVYFGSSTYNTKEMALLIDGVIWECEQLGIETATPDEIANLKSRWGE